MVGLVSGYVSSPHCFTNQKTRAFLSHWIPIYIYIYIICMYVYNYIYYMYVYIYGFTTLTLLLVTITFASRLSFVSAPRGPHQLSFLKGQ